MFWADLFINSCIIVASLFVYIQVKWSQKGQIFATNSWVDGIASGILGNILMYFSIQVTSETIVDLRFIPVMLCMLFLGAFPSFIATIIIILGRFLYGFNISSVAALILMIIIFIGFYIINKRVKEEGDNIWNKVFAMILHANVTFAIIVTLIVMDWDILKILLPLYLVLSYICGISSIYVVQYLSKSQRLLKKYEQESTTDFLTGLSNVREFDKKFNEIVTISTEKNEPVALMYLDIDHFKHVNDTYGHENGDEVLKQLSKILVKESRSIDHVARKGGEEFTIVLPNCSVEEAKQLGEKIRKAVARHPFLLKDQSVISVTVSIGISQFPVICEVTEHLIRFADQSLYRAKEMGRNRVELNETNR